MCNLYRIPSSLTLKKFLILLLLPVCDMGASQILRGVSASQACSLLTFTVDPAFLTLLRGILLKSCLWGLRLDLRGAMSEGIARALRALAAYEAALR